MTFDVVECMLCDVRNSCVGVLPNVARLRNDFPSQNFDHCRLPRTVLTHAAYSRGHRNLDGDVEESWDSVSYTEKQTTLTISNNSSCSYCKKK